MQQWLRNVYYLAHSTFLEAIRNRILWVIVAFAFILCAFNIVFTTLFSWDLGKVSIEFGLSAISFTGLLLVFFLGIKILSDDLERKRVFLLLARPVTSGQYISGKYLGLAFTLFMSSLIMGIGSSVSMVYVIGKFSAFIPQNFSWVTYFMSLASQLLALLIILSFSLLCYCFSSNTFVAVLLSILIYLVGQNMELLRKVITENPYAGVISGRDKFFTFISWIFPNLSYFDKKTVAAYGLMYSFSEFFLLFLYSLSYILVMLTISTYIFKRKEFL